jgi:hypothetical protein
VSSHEPTRAVQLGVVGWGVAAVSAGRYKPAVVSIFQLDSG